MNLRDGIRRVNDAPAILIGVWLLMLAAGVPLSLAGTAVTNVGTRLMQAVTDQAIGIGGSLNTTGPSYIVLWLFLSGGIIDRYARDRPTRAHGFFAVSGVFFFRFLRLAVVMGIAYGLIFSYLRPWLFDDLGTRILSNVTTTPAVLLTRIALYSVFGVALATCNLIFDYTQIRAVVEDRRSVLGAMAAAAHFVGAHFTAVAWLYLADAMLLVVAIVVYGRVGPHEGAAGASLWPLVAGQLYVLARIWVKLVFWASETALFQSQLAHAGYVAKALPAWPEAPIAEAISRS